MIKYLVITVIALLAASYLLPVLIRAGKRTAKEMDESDTN